MPILLKENMDRSLNSKQTRSEGNKQGVEREAKFSPEPRENPTQPENYT
jgi:hypothetical protein